MKYFAEERRAVNYIIPELVATLQDDINNQKANGEPEKDHIELEDKIKDIEDVQPGMEAGPALLEACKYVVRHHRENDSGEGELFGLDFVTTCIAAIAKAEGKN